MIIRRCAIPVVCLSLFWMNVAAHAAEIRMWTDANGKTKIRATYVSSEDGRVTLQRPNGTEFVIELKNLSKIDQKFVADLEAKAGPKPKAADPEEAAKLKEAAKPKRVELLDDGPFARQDRQAFRGARFVSADMSAQSWKFDPVDPAALPVKLKPVAIKLPALAAPSEWVEDIVGSRSEKFAALGILTSRGADPKKYRVVVVNLAEGKVIGDGTLPGDFKILGIHDDGQHVLLAGESAEVTNHLQIWKVADRAEVQADWTASKDVSRFNLGVYWGEFLGDDRLVTTSRWGRLIVWSRSPLKPLSLMEMGMGATPAVSPDAKWLAFSHKNAVGILDVESGEVAALQPCPTERAAAPSFEFSPSQSRLLLSDAGRVHIWNFCTGELQTEFPVDQSQFGLSWMTDDHFLVSDWFLVDVETRVNLWEYKGGARKVIRLGGNAWFLSKENSLVGAEVPPPEAKLALTKALTIPDFFVLKPGTTVKLDVSGVDPAGRQLAETGLTTQLQQAGFVLSPTGTVELIAQTEIGPERQATFTFGVQAASKTLNVRDYFSRVKFVHQGQVVWQSQTGGGRWPFILLQPNETLEQHVAKLQKLNFNWFGAVTLPRLVQKPLTAKKRSDGEIVIETLGASTVTATAVETVKPK